MKRTPEQKLARQIQAATGRTYTDCLAEVKARICAEQKDGPEVNNFTTPEIEAEYEAFKTRWQQLYGGIGNAHHVRLLGEWLGEEQ